MAGEGTKRIIDLTEAAETQSGDYIAIDSTGRGTRKLPAGFMATAEDLSEEQTARQTADATLDGKITTETQARLDADNEIGEQITALDEKTEADAALIQNPTKTLSGALCSFTDGADMPMVACTAEIVPKQSGSGTPSPSNVRTISGWESVSVTDAGKNLFGGEAFANGIKTAIPQAVLDTDAKTISYLSGYASEGSNFTNDIPFKENTQYTIILKFSNTKARTNMRVFYADGTTAYIPTSTTGLQTVVFTSAANKTIDYLGGMNSDGTSVFYYDECGVFEGVLTADQFEPYNGHTTTTSLGRTVYGGTLDVVSGALTVTHKRVNLGDYEWNYLPNNNPPIFYKTFSDKALKGDDIICEKYKTAYFTDSYTIYGNSSSAIIYINDPDYTDAAAFSASLSGVYAVYELAEPQTYQLTPTEVKTLLGENNVWADAGDVEITYRRDISIVINNLESALNG